MGFGSFFKRLVNKPGPWEGLDDADLDMANLDGAVLYKAKIRRTLFPLERLPMDRIQDSIRSGRRLVMDKEAR